MPRERDEPVRLTRIYTGGGDRGETSLGDGTRVPKLDCRIAAFGAVDELNSLLGVVLAADVPDDAARGPGACSERALRPGSRPLGAVRSHRPAADHARPDHRSRAGLRPLQRRPSGADELRVAGRIGGGGAPPRRARRVPPRRAGSARGGRGARDQPACARLPEPTLRPPLHPRPGGERRWRGTPLEAGQPPPSAAA